MRIAPTLLVTLAAGMLTPTLASAEPEFRWLNDWQYTLSAPDVNSSSFFDSTTADQATGGLHFNPPRNGGAPPASVMFSRMFELSGDPQGWRTILRLQAPSSLSLVHASMVVDFYAEVEETTLMGLASLTLLSPVAGPIPFGAGSSAILADGIYTISGVHGVTVTSVSPFGDFLTTFNDTFSVSLEVTPLAVPEPASVALLGLGGVGAWLVLGRRRRGRRAA